MITTMRRSMLAMVLVLGGAPAMGAEFCTQPAATANDRACHGALADGFGGLLAFEREPGEGQHLGVYAQWLGADFTAQGDEITLAQETTGPMWRPRVALLDADTAFVIWGDGRNRVGETYEGFDMRGVVLRRGEAAPAASFVLINAGTTAGVMDPELYYDPASNMIVAAGWFVGLAPNGEPLPTVLGYDRDELLAAREALPAVRFSTSQNRFGQIAFDHSRRLLKMAGAAGPNVALEVATLWAPPDVTPRTTTADLGERFVRGEEHGAPWPHHGSLAIGPEGEMAMVTGIVRNGAPAEYAAILLAADGTIRSRCVYAGPTVTDWNLQRPKVAFSGSDPVLFLPIQTNKEPGSPMALFVAPLVDGEITAADGDTYPLPGALEQFDIIIADHGTTGKAALIASTGAAPVKVCVWPSELIGY